MSCMKTDLKNKELLARRVGILKKIRQELKPKKLTENQAIFRTVLKTHRKLPISGEGNDYIEYQIDDLNALRLRILHPDPPEHKIGADAI